MAKRQPLFQFPPFGVLADALSQTEDFISDTRVILDMSEDTFVRLRDTVVEFHGFIDGATFSGLVNNTLQPKENPEAVSRVLSQLDRYLRYSDEPLAKSMTLLKTAIVEHAKSLEDQERVKLGERLESLLALPEGIARQHKAEQLTEATGRELSRLQIICDVRPIFDKDRTAIEGALPISTLTLDLAGSDAQTSSLEVNLSERQLGDLSKKCESAKRKIALIKKMLREKEVTIPKTRATLDEGEDT